MNGKYNITRNDSLLTIKHMWCQPHLTKEYLYGAPSLVNCFYCNMVTERSNKGYFCKHYHKQRKAKDIKFNYS